MSIITLDFETFYRSAKNKGTEGPRFSLRMADMTYENYLGHELFKVHGVGIKIDNEPTVYYNHDDTVAALQGLFTEDNDHILIAHNALFDGAILSWFYGLRSRTYWCTQAMCRAVWQTESSSLANLAELCFPDNDTIRKGDELDDSNGFRDLTPEQDETLGGYCINDVDVTFECFKHMYGFFPASELELIDITLQMFIHPTFILDRPRVQAHMEDCISKRNALIEASGYTEKILGSDAQFAARVLRDHGITIERIPSPTKKNPENTKLALAKDDILFLELRKERDDLDHIWAGRVAAKSTGEISRCRRLLEHSQPSRINSDGHIAMPLNYSAAHTLRWGGTNKINPQNFKRGSELRLSLMAPAGQKVTVADLSNIEARMLAWFAGEEILNQAYIEERDIYSEVASKIFDRTIDRKKKLMDADGNYLDKNGDICDKDDAIKPDEFEGHVGKVTVLGLGFQMGVKKFKDTLARGPMGAAPIHFDWNMCHKIVHQVFRGTYPNIVNLWADCERVIRMMSTKDLEPTKWRGLIIEPYRLRMPNGLYLNYPGLRRVDHPDGGYEYWEGKYWKSLYGGILTENIIQCLARIVMGEMMITIREKITPMGASVALTVHDEVIAIGPTERTEEIYNTMIKVMRQPPQWCNDGRLALDAEGGWADNYSK